jgi:hypothetical protein
MMSDRNDLPYPVGRQEFGGGSPAGAVTTETWSWWSARVKAARDYNEIVIGRHHHMLRETTVASGDFEGVARYPDGRRYRHRRYHGVAIRGLTPTSLSLPQAGALGQSTACDRSYWYRPMAIH